MSTKNIIPDNATLWDLAADGARRHGSKVALEHGDARCTYADLVARARAFGERLEAAGLEPGQRVLLQLENSIEYACALVGAFQRGLVVAPVNPNTNAERLAFMAQDLDARGWIVRRRVRDRLGDALPPVDFVVALEARFEQNAEWFGGEDLLAGQPPDAVAPAEAACPDADALAMVLYTSGTTGKPKGVMLSHRNLLANSRSIVEYLGLTAADSIVNVLPFFYSFGNSILTTHLLAGARIVIENGFMYPSRLVETMQRVRPTGFSGVPSTFYILLHKTDFLQRDWSFLRYLSQAGGGMRMETIRKLRASLPSTEIVIMYGQTEGAARLSYLPPGRIEDKLGSIGQAIPDVKLRVVDLDGNDLPPGEVGEIVARGENVMSGYLNNPAATAEALRHGWLWTGDMARRDEDGFFYIVSRKSDFIKSASYRVGPGEVEEVIAEVPGIEDVAVFSIANKILGEAIAACVACPAEAFDPSAIERHCRRRMPAYMVPRHILHDPDIPCTASGKKRYHVLRERYASLSDIDEMSSAD